MMHRYPIQLNIQARQELEMLLNTHTTEQRLAKRAKIILLSGDGMGIEEIAAKLDCSIPRVCAWKRRY